MTWVCVKFMIFEVKGFFFYYTRSERLLFMSNCGLSSGKVFHRTPDASLGGLEDAGDSPDSFDISGFERETKDIRNYRERTRWNR